MKILKAEHILIDSNGERSDRGCHPALALKTDEGDATIMADDCKFIRYDHDIVFLGSEWDGILPPIHLPPDPERGAGALTLRGFTDDRDVAEAARDFLEWVFEGPPPPVVDGALTWAELRERARRRSRA